MSKKYNYLRFMCEKEYDAFKKGELTSCNTKWRGDEPPKFYFFGIEPNTLEDIDLLDALDVGYYFIEQGLAFDFCNGTNTYNIAVLFEHDGSLEREYAEDYGDSYKDWKDVVQFKTENYNHLKVLEARYCFLEILGERNQVVALEDKIIQ